MRFILLCLALLCHSLPAMAQDAGPNGPIATENSAGTDAAIATRIRDILGELGTYDDVTVQVADGIVTLRGTTTSMVDIANLNALVNRVQGVVAVKTQVTETTDIVRRLDPALDRFMARVDQLITILPLAVIALCVFLAVTFLGRALARLKRPWDRIAPNAFIADLFRQIVQIVFGIGGLVVALDILNATALLSTILGAAGIVGLALGFAVRDTVENYIASVMLSIRQPFRPNDTVEINGDQGKVIRLTSRATILLSFDGNHIRIPNATVFKSRIVNFSQNAERRFKFTICVDPGTDLSIARALAADTVQALPFVLPSPPAQAWLDNLTDAGVEVTVTGWIDQNETSILLARGEALRLVKLAFETAGIGIPDTTYRIVVDGGGHLPLPTAASDIGPATRAVAPATRASETLTVAEVDATTETALEKFIDAERTADENEDLLRRDALHE